MSAQMKSLEEVRRLAGEELSLKARLGYVALLLAASGMTSIIVSLWLTEPALPLRTRWAFGAMSVIGASWMALALWVLRARRPLLARDRVVAGGMAVVFTSVFLAGGLAAALSVNTPAAYGVLATGGVMLASAIAALVSARRRFAELVARRAALTR